MTQTPPLDEKSKALRRNVVKMLAAAQRGHVGSAFSLIEILRVLYEDFLNVRPKEPRWVDRDRCVMSKGHGCLAFYAVLQDKGFFPEEELWKFCKFDGMLGGHPEFLKVPGVEASTGSLGHGLPIAVGMAVDAKRGNKKHKVYVVSSDGECNEGSTWEAALCAAKHKLDNLIILIDYNKQQSYSTTEEVLNLEPLNEKWRAFGFEVYDVDGHNRDEIRNAIKSAHASKGKPITIICHTIKGKGISFVERNLAWHHKNKVSQDEVQALLGELA